MTTSDFDQMMADANAGQFNLTEPPLNNEEAVETAFFSSEPVNAQSNTPPVNTEVRTDELAQGGNPFADAATDTGVTVAANYQSSQTADPVEQVAFTEEETTGTANVTSTTGTSEPPPNLQPFRRDGIPQAQPEVKKPEQFPLFGETKESELPRAASRLPSCPRACFASDCCCRCSPAGCEATGVEEVSRRVGKTRLVSG